MKGVIMAGGKGTRLRPLTCNLPKPMVPILEKPVMEYAIELLKRYKVTEIAVTVHYLPEHIKQYFGDGSQFGVQLHYFEETTPLGTAGSIKNAEPFLDEQFIVISGDALTDFNLQDGIDFHNQKDALATIFMKQVESPLEYGVIMTDDQDRIIRFLEKPSWNEVFSDTVNTGIYILEPEVFRYLTKGVPTDFSKDLFPLLMKENKGLYGFEADGYWSDIGSLNQYRKSHEDFLDGLIDLPVSGHEILPGVRVGKDVVIEELATVKAPVYIGSGTIIRKHAKILPYTVIGSHSKISPFASLKRSILWNEVFVGGGSELRGTTIATSTFLDEGSSLYEHSVIGNQVHIGKKVTVKPEVKVWPEKGISDDTVVHTSLIWGKKTTKSLFANRGISGIANIEITPDFVARVASAYGSVLAQGGLLGVASDDHPFSELILKAFIQGLHSSGVHTVDISPTMAPILRFTIEQEEWIGGAYIRFCNHHNQMQVVIELYDENGLPIESTMERKIENAFWQEDYRRAPFDKIGIGINESGKSEKYMKKVFDMVNVRGIQESAFKIVLNANGSPFSMVSRLFERFNCSVITVPSETTQEKMIGVVQATDSHLGIWIDQSGEKLQVMTEDGKWLNEDQMLSLYVLLAFGDHHLAKYAVPVYGSSELDHLAKKLNGTLLRTKADARSILQVGDTVLNVQYDAIFALSSILNMIATRQLPLTQLVKMLPDIKLIRESVQCPSKVKGRVMRKLMEETKGQQIDLVDGIKVYHPDGGWTLILPDIADPAFTVYSQAADLESAKEISRSYVHKIKSYQQL
ncbi:sugar phosphate nucleotidyltransferase [Alkalihalobacillus sp. AL-G]|uniref:sugar phosphate nucleotidyltransferase n=1 Tax=Alkalihalobacillus sp. AL-G TaxID=2926399 RepID=UPI00272D7776|nr:sugar phosphate nucleotidyltransferase [Alkalihalobacillus sp. AL-G]WLD92072.1 sugar phosphate nucleotidyltransferase [Alkalihalobacillus sp. AL-G]